MDQRPLSILIVEDDEDYALIIEDLILDGLAAMPPKIEHILSGEEAISRLTLSSPYDLCLFDYRLGAMHGIELLREIRAKGIITPIILLTGQGDQEIAVEAMKAGATDYLVKSHLSPEQLFHSIRYCIKLHREGEQRKDAEEKLKKSHADLVQAHEKLQHSMAQLQTAQNHIVRSEKLASIGRLAAGVCHELLNPLNIISGHVQVLLMERGEDYSLHEDLQSITEEILRIEKIVGGLLKFSRKGDVNLQETDINRELNSVLAIIEKEMGLQNIAIIREYDENLPKVLIDSDRIRQVFLNIINNAKYAMEHGGAFTVKTQSIAKGPEGKVIQLNPHLTSNRTSGSREPNNWYLRIQFIDTGTGIKKEDLGKLFDPFFTTKPEDKGTGLGLSVCYAIIEKHGGNLEVDSEYGKGSTFMIDLPLKNSIQPPEQE